MSADETEKCGGSRAASVAQETRAASAAGELLDAAGVLSDSASPTPEGTPQHAGRKVIVCEISAPAPACLAVARAAAVVAVVALVLAVGLGVYAEWGCGGATASDAPRDPLRGNCTVLLDVYAVCVATRGSDMCYQAIVRGGVAQVCEQGATDVYASHHILASCPKTPVALCVMRYTFACTGAGVPCYAIDEVDLPVGGAQ